MSARNTTSLLAIILLVASAAHISAQDANAPLDVANVPASTGAFVLRDVDLLRSQSTATFGVLEHNVESGSTALSENAWDFTRPDSNSRLRGSAAELQLSAGHAADQRQIK